MSRTHHLRDLLKVNFPNCIRVFFSRFCIFILSTYERGKPVVRSLDKTIKQSEPIVPAPPQRSSRLEVLHCSNINK